MNNLKQVAFASANYESDHRAYVPAASFSYWGHLGELGDLAREDVFMDFSESGFSTSAPLSHSLGALLCPLDDWAEADSGHFDDVFNDGTGRVAPCYDGTGVLREASPCYQGTSLLTMGVSANSIGDGMSNSALLSERLISTHE